MHAAWDSDDERVARSAAFAANQAATHLEKLARIARENADALRRARSHEMYMRERLYVMHMRAILYIKMRIRSYLHDCTIQCHLSCQRALVRRWLCGGPAPLA